jgi:serine phosphatase RsbU (regulator of sigma subunit)
MTLLRGSEADDANLTKIIEAMNERGELYGFERLLGRIQGAPNGSVQELQEWALSDVGAFMASAEQHDDTTLVVFWLTA